MSNMDIWSGLRWISALTMMLWYHFHVSSGSEFPNLGPTWPVKRYKGAPICPWDSIPITQTLCMCLPWMYEVVWGGCQPQPWRYGIISNPQVTLSLQILGQPGHCNGIRVHPYALETAHQRLKHVAYVCYGCLKQSEVDLSLNHDVMASFTPWLAMSGFVSAGSTTQLTDIFVCRWHVVNVSPTRQQHSVMSTNILAVSVVSGNFVADTFSYT